MDCCLVHTIKALKISRLRHWAAAIRRDVHALYLAARDPRVPWVARALALCIAGYALSPIDLIPDFVPVLGLLDDLVIVPLGIVLALRLVPPEVLAEHRRTAELAAQQPVSRSGAAVIIAIWLILAAAAGWWIFRY